MINHFAKIALAKLTAELLDSDVMKLRVAFAAFGPHDELSFEPDVEGNPSKKLNTLPLKFSHHKTHF